MLHEVFPILLLQLYIIYIIYCFRGYCVAQRGYERAYQDMHDIVYDGSVHVNHSAIYVEVNIANHSSIFSPTLQCEITSVSC